MIDYKDIKMLFREIVNSAFFENELPKILDVIKLPHHGSAGDISLEFIKIQGKILFAVQLMESDIVIIPEKQ